jgi:hypothetical protein
MRLFRAMRQWTRVVVDAGGRTRSGAVGTAIVLVVLVAPGSAAASVNSFCVVPASSCPGADTYTSLGTALTHVADNGATGATIQLGAAAYNETDDVIASSLPVTIIGAGQGQTILNGVDSTTHAVLAFNPGSSFASAIVEDLSVVLPQGASNDDGILNQNGGGAAGITVSNVTVTDPAAASGNTGLSLGEPDTMSHVTVDMSATGDIGAHSVGTVQDSSITAPNGGIDYVGLPAGSMQRVVRTTITVRSLGILVGLSEPTVADCVLSAGIPLAANGGTTSVVGSTLTPTATGPGISMDSNSTPTQLTLVGSIIDSRTALHSIAITQGAASATLITEADDFAGATSTLPQQPSNGVTVAGGATFAAGPGNIDVDPRFAGTSDLRLLPGSPAMNQVTVSFAPLVLNESATDLLGHPRQVANTPLDMGAYQHQPPTAMASATPSRAATGKPVTFSASGASINPGDSFTYTWKFDDGAAAAGQSVTHPFKHAGTHTATVTVTGAGPDGFSATATATATATSPGKPTVSHVSLTGIAKGKPKLALTIASGKGAPGLATAAITLPNGLSFSHHSRSLTAGIAVKDAHGKRVKFTTRLHHGILTIVLKHSGAKVTITIAPPAISASHGFMTKVTHHKLKTVALALTLGDTAHTTTKLKPKTAA